MMIIASDTSKMYIVPTYSDLDELYQDHGLTLVNCKNAEDEVPLHTACRSNNVAVIKKLIEYHEEYCSSLGDEDKVKLIIHMIACLIMIKLKFFLLLYKCEYRTPCGQE